MKGQAPTITLPDGLAELQAALEETWPAHLATLRASGVALNEIDEEAQAKADAEAKSKADADAAAAKKPWGDDKDFDPDRAWKLIQDTRADREKLKTEREALAVKVKQHEDASKTAEQKAADETAEAKATAKTATLEAGRLRVALKKGLTETQAKRLVGDTEEELEKDADELLASFKTEDDETRGKGPGRRPTEKLRPGAAPESEADENDPEKLAASVPRMY